MPARRLELVSPERFFAPEMGGMNHVPYMRAFHEKGVTRHHQHAGEGGAARRQPAGRDARLGFRRGLDARSAASTRSWSSTARAPLDELYFALKPLSKNGGAVDYERLVEGGDIFPHDAARGGLRAVSDRRRRGVPQHPRGGLRRHSLRAQDLACVRIAAPLAPVRASAGNRRASCSTHPPWQAVRGACPAPRRFRRP